MWWKALSNIRRSEQHTPGRRQALPHCSCSLALCENGFCRYLSSARLDCWWQALLTPPPSLSSIGGTYASSPLAARSALPTSATGCPPLDAFCSHTPSVLVATTPTAARPLWRASPPLTL